MLPNTCTRVLVQARGEEELVGIQMQHDGIEPSQCGVRCQRPYVPPSRGGTPLEHATPAAALAAIWPCAPGTSTPARLPGVPPEAPTTCPPVVQLPG